MELKDVIDWLRANRDRLTRDGVTHAAVFGSLARGEAGKASDIDIAIELDPSSKLSLFGLVRLEEDLTRLLGCKVDLVAPSAHAKRLRAEIERDGVVAF